MPPRIPHRIVNGVELKRCSRCHEWLPLDAFQRYAKEADGLRSDCGPCKREAERSRHRVRTEWDRDLKRAITRALHALRRAHPVEYAALLAIERERVEAEVLLGYHTVSEHKRRVYGVPTNADS